MAKGKKNKGEPMGRQKKDKLKRASLYIAPAEDGTETIWFVRPRADGTESIPEAIPLSRISEGITPTVERLEVELKFVEGQAHLMLPGQPFVPRETAVAVEAVVEAKVATTEAKASHSKPVRLGESARKAGRRGFYNPYNFIPAPDRDGRVADGLGDGPPVGHHRLAEDHWSGRITIALRAETPLLIAAANPKERDGHKTFDLRRDPDGKPYLPPASLKGMLRAAFEAVTNSRMGIFREHEGRLGFRREAKNTAEPAVVIATKHGLALQILVGAAKLRCYDKYDRSRDRGRSQRGMKYQGTQDLPQHGDRVAVELDRKGLKVVEIMRCDDDTASPSGMQRGWVCITGPNISGKQYERVFLDNRREAPVPLTEKIRKLWSDLIDDYQSVHVRDLAKRQDAKRRPDDYLGDEPGQTAFSRHVYTESARELRKGDLCYVVRDRNKQITALQPVTISRQLHDVSPHALLPDSLHPAAELDQLSPAERVFGWVNPQGRGAHQGQLRVGPVRCESADAVEAFNPALPLAILGQPKPQQARFYVAKDTQGTAQNDGEKVEAAGYQSGKGLRGRKVYPHHAGLPDGYWGAAAKTGVSQSVGEGPSRRYREYLHPATDDKDRRTDQNRSIKAWVKPGTEFTCDLDVTNLSAVELGALLWLLQLDPEHYHRFGGGKPLGFGSLRIDIAALDLKTGAAQAEDWRTLAVPGDADSGASPNRLAWRREETGEPWPAETDARVGAFQKAVSINYGAPFDKVPFIAAVLQAAQGFDDLPTHYPRAGQPPEGPVPPSATGENFKWFGANEQIAGGQCPGHALPDLRPEVPPALPYLEEKPAGGQGRGGRGGRPGGGRGGGGGGRGGRRQW